MDDWTSAIGGMAGIMSALPAGTEVSWQKWTLPFHVTVLQKDCAKMTGAM